MRSPCWNNVDYRVSQPFLPGPPAVHCGIDIECPSGTIIRAARAGTVERVQTGMVAVHVDGSSQRDFYLHGYSLVVVGQRVAAGTPVIHSDTVQVDPRYPLTGPHLHFEVQDGYALPGAPPAAPGHPLDPVPVLTGVFGGQPGHREEPMTDSEKKAHVRHAYNAGLGREPESNSDGTWGSGPQGWVNAIKDDGSNVDSVVSQIYDSHEGQQYKAYQAKLKAMVETPPAAGASATHKHHNDGVDPASALTSGPV